MKDVFSKWSFLSLTGFITWLLIVGSLMFLTLTTRSLIFPLLLFGFTLLPLLILMAAYAYRALENKRYAGAIIYPLIDFFRVLSFCSGQVYQLFKKSQAEK
jgi:hypothetical protein